MSELAGYFLYDRLLTELASHTESQTMNSWSLLFICWKYLLFSFEYLSMFQCRYFFFHFFHSSRSSPSLNMRLKMKLDWVLAVFSFFPFSSPRLPQYRWPLCLFQCDRVALHSSVGRHIAPCCSVRPVSARMAAASEGGGEVAHRAAGVHTHFHTA